MNISEIIIMAKTAVQSLQRVFPGVNLFQSKNIQEEIKTVIMNLFQTRIEDQLK